MKAKDFPSDWDEKKKELKSRYPELSDEDLFYHKGNEEQLVSHLQEKLNKTRGDIKRIIKRL